MMINVSELTNQSLNWAIAKCEGKDITRSLNKNRQLRLVGNMIYTPSSDWSQGGPIIERERIGVYLANHSTEHCAAWQASIVVSDKALFCKALYCDGPTPLIAAMRCFVASKLGDEIEIPDILT